MTRTLMAAVVLVAGIASLAAGAQTKVAFEVASIKENRSGQIYERFFYQYPASGRVVVINNTAKMIIRTAYGLPDYRLSGGPSWLDETRFDVQAKAAGPVTSAQLLQMLRSLLEDRFKLVMKEEQREGPVLALLPVTPGRLGPNVSPATADDRRMYPVGLRSPVETQGSAATMQDLAAFLSNRMGRHVVDKTGVTGIYNFTIKTGGDGARARGPVPPPEALRELNDQLPALTTALREQLGLRLESQRGVVPFYVIERVAKPDVEGVSTTAEPVTAEPPAR
jgi:uncharacterized protein (TIGR03435 family)